MRGFKILDCLGDAGTPLTVSEVSRRTGLHRATAHRLLNVMLGLGYVHKNQADSTYSTGFYLHAFGHPPSILATIVHHARPFLIELAGKTGETVCLGALEGIQMFYCEVVAGGPGPTARLCTGQRYDAHTKAIGKALLSLRPAEEVRRCYENHRLSAHTTHTITSLAELERALSVARDDGVAIEDREFREDWRGVAAPIMNPAGRAISAISVEAPAVRMTDQNIQSFVREVGATARRIADYLLRPCRPAQPSVLPVALSQGLRQTLPRR